MDIKYSVKSSSETQKRKDRLQLPVLIGMTLILVMLIFIVDRISNPDIALGVSYIIVVLFSWLFPKNIHSVVTSIVCVLLVVFDYYQTQSTSIESEIQLSNLLLSISSIAVTLLLVVVSKVRTNDIKKLNLNLEDKVYGRTLELQKKIVEVREKNNIILKTQSELIDAISDVRESEYKFKKLFNDAPDANLMVNEKGLIINNNKKTKDIFGYKKKELNHTPIKDLLPDFEEIINPLKKEKKVGTNIEVVCIQKDGTTFPGEISVNPIIVGNSTTYSVAIRNISERKKSELYSQLQNKKLAAKNKELEQFVYIASHDLQEPLRTMSTFSQMITEEYAEQYGEEAKTMLNHITESSERMTNLLRGLLEYGRLGRSRKKVEVDCNTLIQQIYKDLDTLIKENNVELITDKLPKLVGYHTELKVLFENLIINAIKFKKADVTPKVTISAQRLSDKWEFSVSDNGIGIEEKHIEKIFVIFKRLHKRDVYKGYGIGLAQVKKIVDLHEGEIIVSSLPMQGTTFKFTISDTIL